MKLIHIAMIGKTTARKISFSVNPNLTFNTTSYPSLVAWEFSDVAGNKNVVALNLSNQTYNVNLGSLFGTTTSVLKEDITTSNIFQKNITTTGLTFSNTSISPASTLLSPYSLSKISSSVSVGISESNLVATDYSIYPNPTTGEVSILSKNYTNNLTINVYNAIGQLIQTKNNANSLNLSNELAGIYFIELKNSSSSIHFKVIKQ
jgi:hypothetical protein